MKRLIAFLSVVLLTVGLLAGCGVSQAEYDALQQEYDELEEKYNELKEKTDKGSTNPTGDSTEPTQRPTTDATEDSNDEPNIEESHPRGYVVELVITDYGTITLELDRTAAPITVDNFVQLVQDGFYDGLTFHRIIEGFVMQGGDPEGTGFGGSANKIKGEFTSNGWDNPISHVRGTISMARANDPDSASSQFFIMHQDYTGLDGSYAAFGRVTEGMEVVDAICEAAQPTDGNGTIPADNQPVIESIRVVEVLMP